MRGQQSSDRTVPNLVVVVGTEGREAAEAGVVDQDVKAAEARGDLADDAFDLSVIENVEAPSVRDATGGGDFLDDARATPAALMSVTATSAPSSANK